jgi:hypothetical protein
MGVPPTFPNLKHLRGNRGELTVEPAQGAVACTACVAGGGWRYAAARKANAAPEKRAIRLSSATRNASLMAAMLARTPAAAFPRANCLGPPHGARASHHKTAKMASNPPQSVGGLMGHNREDDADHDADQRHDVSDAKRHFLSRFVARLTIARGRSGLNRCGFFAGPVGSFSSHKSGFFYVFYGYPELPACLYRRKPRLREAA